MDNEGVYINGMHVSFKELESDVQAAKKKGLSGQWAFTPETVEALVEHIKERQGEA